jgi:hypothetical protein
MHPDLKAALRKAGKLRPARADDGRDAAPVNGHHPGDEVPAPLRTLSATWQSRLGSCADRSRNDTITRLAGHLLRRYVEPIVVLDLMLTWNATRCEPPLPAHEVIGIVNWVAGKELARRKSA